MESEKQEDLFEIKLTEVGRSYILKTARIAGVVLAIGTINSIVTLLGSAVRLSKFSAGPENGQYWRNMGVIDVLIVLGMALNIIAIFKYYFFIVGLNRSIRKIDERQFSLSFRHLYHNILFFLTVVILSALDTILFFLSSPGSFL